MTELCRPKWAQFRCLTQIINQNAQFTKALHLNPQCLCTVTTILDALRQYQQNQAALEDDANIPCSQLGHAKGTRVG